LDNEIDSAFERKHKSGRILMTEKNSLINPKASFLSNGFLVIVFALFFWGHLGASNII